jgi:hypothetical protein
MDLNILTGERVFISLSPPPKPVEKRPARKRRAVMGDARYALMPDEFTQADLMRILGCARNVADSQVKNWQRNGRIVKGPCMRSGMVRYYIYRKVER